MSDILLKQPAFTAGLPRLYIKVDLNWIILKNFKISCADIAWHMGFFYKLSPAFMAGLFFI